MKATKIFVASFGLGFFSWLVPSSIEISSWSKSGIDRVALFAPLYMLWAALAASAALAAVLWWAGKPSAAGREHRAYLVAPLGALWILVAPFLPWAGDRFPLVLILAGPLKWLVAAAALTAVLVRALRTRAGALAAVAAVRGWLAHRGRATVFVLSLALFLGVGLRSLRIVGLGGDEPHYLIITHSLLVDHDIKIENNHARGDYRAFFAGDLHPDYLQRGVDGEIYSIHAPGLSALMLPGYAVAGSRGAVATVCFFAAIAATAIFEAAFLLAGSLIAWATWASVCLSVPFVPHAWSLYPEIVGAAVVAAGVVWALRQKEVGLAAWALRGAFIAILPWLHTKFIVLLAALTLWMVVELRGRLKPTIALLAPIAISCAAWFAFFYVLYGTLDPQAPYGQHAVQFVKVENLPRSLLGTFFDQKFGLFVYAPIYLAAVAGAWLLLRDRRRRRFAAFLVGTAALYSLSSARYYMWWGGSSAPARFLVPLVPLMAPMVAAAFARAKRSAQPALLSMLAVGGVLVSAAGVAGFDRLLLFSDPHGTSRMFQVLQGSAPLTAAFPTFTDENWHTPLLHTLPWLAAGTAVLLALVVASRWRSRLWAMLVAGATFVGVAAVAAAPIPAEARSDAATRGRMALMQAFDPQHLRAFDYARRAKMSPAEWIAAGGMTLDLDPTEPVDGYGRLAGPLALAPGAYTATVWFQGSRQREGDLMLALGGGQVLRRVSGPLPNPTVVSFDMPVAIPQLWVQLTEVATAQQAVRVELTPASIVPASERLNVPVGTVDSIPGRPGAYMEYIDEWTYPEGGVFWTRATGKGEVIVAPAGANQILLTLHVGPNAGRVRLTVAGKVEDVQMRAEETRVVSIPVSAAPYVRIAVESAVDFRPADADQSSADVRHLGCQVRVEVR